MACGLIPMHGPARVGAAAWTPEHPALTPVANRALVLHAIDAVRAAGADEVVVTGDAESLGAAAAVLAGAGVTQVETGRCTSTGDALLAAADHVRGERIVVHDAEGLLVRGARGPVDAAIADDAVDATLFYRGQSPTGVGVFSDSILGALAATPPDEDGCVSLLDAVERLAAGGGRVAAGALDDWWAWEACAERLLELNRIVLDAMEAVSDVASSPEGSRLEGRVTVHPTARLENAVVRGPVIIGAHARVTDAYVGPFTTVGDGATIENSEIESSIVLPRARIRHVGVRVEASIVGAGATVGRDFALPRALRLRIGRDASVTLG